MGVSRSFITYSMVILLPLSICEDDSAVKMQLPVSYEKKQLVLCVCHSVTVPLKYGRRTL